MIVLVLFTFGFGIAVGFSANGLATIANEIPDWLRIGFRVAGGLLPALGFALILKVMIKKEYLGFVFIGYFLTLVFQAIATVTKTSFSVLGLAITAFGLVMIIISIAKLAGFDNKLKAPIMQMPMHNQNQAGGQDDGI
ncbi:conserved domain protein [Mycoplasmopsis alligatoris A21JP2]|uniref:Conserved domain protein n=2 Tax=Mycoplasmopsis alligatoris TaxID=47687 RepID=D4XVV6_9BACT|nr:conserved domain protein [Mycoplasmopsis alligatoris A21JP2]